MTTRKEKGRRPAEKILDGLRDAVAFAKGDKTKGKLYRVHLSTTRRDTRRKAKPSRRAEEGGE